MNKCLKHVAMPGSWIIIMGPHQQYWFRRCLARQATSHYMKLCYLRTLTYQCVRWIQCVEQVALDIVRAIFLFLAQVSNLLLETRTWNWVHPTKYKSALRLVALCCDKELAIIPIFVRMASPALDQSYDCNDGEAMGENMQETLQYTENW